MGILRISMRIGCRTERPNFVVASICMRCFAYDSRKLCNCDKYLCARLDATDTRLFAPLVCAEIHIYINDHQIVISEALCLRIAILPHSR